MKRILFFLAFAFCMVGAASAQGGGNGNGNNGNGFGNGGFNNGNAYGQANSPWGGQNYQQWLVTWLENGGQCPPLVAADVLWKARSWGQQNCGLNYGQMLQRYAQGTLTVSYEATTPPSLSFRVSFGGLSIIVLEEI